MRNYFDLVSNLEKKVKERSERVRGLRERVIRAEKMETLGILAGGVAHDLNNVLVSIVGYPASCF
jgi:C4-dicarboxylate-specific signal transduction histidine kinase